MLTDVLTRAGEADREGEVSAEAAVANLVGRWHAARTIVDSGDVPIRGVALNYADGSIVARFDVDRGVVFGDDRAFPWSVVRGPVLLLWHPDDGVTAR